MFGYFYHEILRKTIIGFGTLFNNITIKHFDNDNNVVSVIKVPLAYGPTQKFLARLEQSPDLNKPIQMTLPRMSFEFTGLSYDGSRKVTSTQTFTSPDGNNIQKTYMPVPYNMTFELNIMTKLNDDMLQIVEQILPYFQPSYNLTIELVKEIKEKKDIPIIFEGISMQDEYEGDFDKRRVLLYSLKFLAKTYLFGPTSSVTKDVVKKISVGFVAGDAGSSASRELSYSVEPRALKNYTGIVVTNLSYDITPTDTLITVNNASSILPNTYIDIEGEEIYVKSKDDNTLTVERGRDYTKAISHVSGAEIKSITSSDNLLIQDGDNFGFFGNTI
jgi:hypothetical protein